MANRLAESGSAYLRSAAHQPIDWHEFGEEAFLKAKDEDKPILLDIGAVWCHWCHVIDRESYDNAEIAALINQFYIPVKVDRDQRPDVDARYQQVVQSLTGQGGWPLTAFLTHDGRLIYGGTYFPPDAMKQLMEQITVMYHDRKSEIFNASEMLTAENMAERERQLVRDAVGEKPPIDHAALKTMCQDFVKLTTEAAQKVYDANNGGFGAMPKFPHFSGLEYLIAQNYRDGDAQVREMIEKTLAHMARGGIYDQVAGGFHRYSVDDHWHVPHFEKMAYDNAEALKVYAQGYRLTGIPLYKEVAEGIIRWLNEWLSDQTHGGFYGSQDADINLEDDGDHFTWSPLEIRDTLSDAEASLVSRYYGITDQGDMHHTTGRNVLAVTQPLISVAEAMGISPGDAENLLASAHGKMLEARRKRPIPFIDNSIYVNWNGMLISAYFEAADLLDLPDARDFAEKSLKRMLNEFYVAGDVNHGKVFHAAGVDGFIEDYAWLALACLRAHYSTGDRRYFNDARAIADLIVAHFEDGEEGAFFDTRRNESGLGLLKIRRKPVDDGPSSSANAIALQVLLELDVVSDTQTYRQSIERALVFLVNHHGHYGLYVSALAIAADRFTRPPLKIEIAGDVPDLAREARLAFYPGKVLTYHPEVSANEARVCVGFQCFAPAKTPDDLRQRFEQVAQFHK